MSQRSGQPRFLHIHSRFPDGMAAERDSVLIRAFGNKVEHVAVSADQSSPSGAAGFGDAISVTYLTNFPPLRGLPLPGRLSRLARAMQPFDLILTHGRDALDAAMAHTLFKDAMDLPPLVHHEIGDRALQGGIAATWYRRFAFGKAAGLVVSSERIEEAALVAWQQPLGRVKHIPPGVPVRNYAVRPANDSLPGLIKRKGECWLGSTGPLDGTADVASLVAICAALPENWHLVVVGEGPERDKVAQEADRRGINHRVHLPGKITELSQILGLFDIFALTSHSEQAGLDAVRGMAAGLPLAAFDNGSLGQMVAEENRPFLAAHKDVETLQTVVERLAKDPELRHSIGKANREKASADYDEERMVATYRRLYSSAMRRDDW